MKKSIAIAAAVVLVLMVGLASCKEKEKKTSKTQVPAGHEKMITEMKKNIAESKKVTVVRVNGDVVTLHDLVREMNTIGPRFLRPGQRPTPGIESTVRKIALDNLIFRELAVQEARKQGMKAAPKEIDAAVKQFKTRFRTEAAYKVYLDEQGLTEKDFRGLVEKDLLFKMIISKEIFDKAKNTKFTDKELKKAYQKEKGSFMLPESFAATDILFNSGVKKAGKKEEAEKILGELRSNKGDLNKLSRGNYIVRRIIVTQNMYPNIYEKLETMKTGGVNGIIHEKDGMHIVILKRKNPSREMTFKEARHIVEQQLMSKVVEKRKEEWEKQLKKKAKIQIVLKGEKGIKPAH